VIKNGSSKNTYIIYIMTLLFCIFTGIILLYTEIQGTHVAAFSEERKQPVLIIDPGHGGADGGAVADDGTKESLINLEISLKLKCLSDLLGVESVIIRDSEELPYPDLNASIAEKKKWDQNRRLYIINSADNAVLISIHQNYYPDPQPFGAQVLYAKTDGSRELGEQCHDALNRFLSPENRRVAAPISEKIFLMKYANCPAILVECGFMSNPRELEKLQNMDYQKKIAAIIMAAYLCYAV